MTLLDSIFVAIIFIALIIIVVLYNKSKKQIDILEHEKEKLEDKMTEINKAVHEKNKEQQKAISELESIINDTKDEEAQEITIRSTIKLEDFETINKPAKDLKVLIVDDDMINLKLLDSLLKSSGIAKEVLEAENGLKAVNIVNENNDIDLILLDIVMPIMGGVDTLRVIRSDKNLKQIPIIVLTTDETKRSITLEQGANGFLMKPIKKEQLFKKINDIYI